MSWQAAIEATTRLVVGIGTEADNHFPTGTDFGPAYPILTIDSDAELAVYLGMTGDAYVSRDGQHIVAERPA